MESSVVRVYESGPTTGFSVIVLHGWGSSSTLMTPLSQRLATIWRTIAIDMPGHGASGAPPSAWGVSHQVQIVLDVLRQLKVEQYAMIGHSNGGRISLDLASRKDIVARPSFLVLISPSGIPRRRTATYYLRFWTAKILKWPFLALPGSMREFGLDWLRHSLIWKMLGSSDYRSLSGVMKDTFVLTVNHYITDLLKLISCPVVVFWGENDTDISRQQMEILVDGLPNAGLFVLKNAGHFSYLDQPDVIVTSVHELASEGQL